MSDSRKFASQNLKWKCEAVFYPDRLEWSWDEWGFGISKGKSVVQQSELSPHLTESSTLGLESKGPLITASIYAVLAIFSHALLPMPWRYIEVLFIIGVLIAGGRGLFRFFQKTESINIQLKNGESLAAIVVTKWSEEQRQEFRKFYEAWIKEPNQALQTTPGS